MINLNTEPAELHFTLEIKRKDTGLVETVQMVGHVIKQEEEQNGSDTLDSSS